MEGNVRLGRILGIPVGLHFSWFLIFALVTWSLAVGFFPREYPRLEPVMYWVLGALTSALFFSSVLLHELGHSWVALRESIPVRSITLFIFGGVAQIEQEPKTAGAEFRIAIAGPLVSLALAAIFGALWLFDRQSPVLAAPSIWLARINLTLALFNLIPGFPLDGGRVLRAIIWQISGNFRRATRIASVTGQIVAAGFIGIGLFSILGGNFFNGLWLVFIGWFLQNAAASSYAQVTLQESLRGVTVSQVMTRECARVPSNVSLQEIVDERVLGYGQRCFFVQDDGKLRGMLSLRDVTAVPRSDWSQVTTAEAMTPWESLVNVQPETELMEALRRMDSKNVAQLPVVKDGEMLGVLSREEVLHYIRLRSELGA